MTQHPAHVRGADLSGTQPTPIRMGVGIISAGRVGAVLGNALRACGHQVTGVVAVSDASRERADVMLPGVPVLDPTQVVERSELVILAVPDDELADLVTGLASADVVPGSQIFVHTSGRYGASVLAPLAAKGALTLAMHPAMTFTGTSLDLKRLIGCPWSISASPMFAPIARALVTELEGQSFEIAEADRSAYHMALAHGANHLVVLVDQVMEILSRIGVSDPAHLVGPLLHAALEESLRRGRRALTGPIARGDWGTVAAHVDALRELDIDGLEASYRALALAAVNVAEVSEPARSALHALLNSPNGSEDVT